MYIRVVKKSKIEISNITELPTSASGFEIGATVAELEARVVAVARLVRRVLDDRIDGRLLDDARRVPAGTAEFGLQAAARPDDGHGGRGERHQDDRGRRGGTTSHRINFVITYRDDYRADRPYRFRIVRGTGMISRVL